MIPRSCERMKRPLNEEMKYVAKLVGLHMRPQNVADEGVSDSGVRRLSTDAGDELEDLMLLCEADITSKNPDKVRRQLEGFAKLRKRIAEITAADDYRKWKNPVAGNEIKALFGIGDGPILGQFKQEIKDAILDCRVENTHECSVAYLMQLAKERRDEIEALGGSLPE